MSVILFVSLKWDRVRPLWPHMHMRNFPTVAGAEVMFGFVWNDVWLLCDVVPHIWRLCERACRPDYWELVERMDSWVTARLKCEGGWCRLVRPVSDTGGESKRCWKAERCVPCVCLCVCALVTAYTRSLLSVILTNPQQFRTLFTTSA